MFSDVTSSTAELTLSIWQTSSPSPSSSPQPSQSMIAGDANVNVNGNGNDSMSMSIDTPHKHQSIQTILFNNSNSGKLIGRLTIPYSEFQTHFIDKWYPLTGGQSSCSVHLKMSYTDSNSKVTLDDFLVLKMIGKGGFGHVNLVKKVDTGRLYAMKVVKKEKCLDLNAVQHTFTERELLKKYYHPFIVGLKYSFQTQDSLCMVLEYIGGGELFYHINERETFSEDTARFYIAQIMLAIGFLHEHGVIYRDLKLENLLMDLDGNLCLVDFGLCKEGAKEGVPTYTMCGSPEYMAPETITGTGYGRSVDWWALGTLLYEMIVGLPPFYSEDPHEMTKLIVAAQLKFPAGISKNASSLISMLLNRDPTKRLGSGESDVEEIKSHPFFRSLNWTKVLNKEIDPPFKPHLNGPLDLSYFDPLCTIHSLPVNPNTYNSNLSESDQMAFQGFSYSAPDLFHLINSNSVKNGGSFNNGSFNNSLANSLTSNNSGSGSGLLPSPSLSRHQTTTPPLSSNPATPSTPGALSRSNLHSPMTISPSPLYSFTSIARQQQDNMVGVTTTNNNSSAQNTPTSPPPNPTIKSTGGWVQPQYPHLLHPLPLKPLFSRIQDRRRSLSNATQFTMALGPEDEDM
ncbi:hypothetical protein SAMD00019534_091560 [Acytostelium subglobosum LB1]|uniref:hypothetical protein n=1 Tax=Acytostelium subglobosum LB1 TaxID=1410327 RepID=UPI000644FEF0|nr:hypothetical protein SAMD00019534_091560 [Acytostelium subglobosum LB1]GAM25981.1 hypothetical protein SAMD00019534_091560 [Acytostelium subglobosum LB1]|eukprot:XP_012751024.1 hypothetical protein SAMD00019534_091560 [Acytostelium subglobosum LB1]